MPRRLRHGAAASVNNGARRLGEARGTGTLGRLVVDRLMADETEVPVLTRR
ncbi:MAG: hypothetical protein ACRENY_07600 [Candidatus Dormibacteria bacterium]